MRYPHIPDVRDGLTRVEQDVLHGLHEAQKERGGRNVPTAMLWGRVCDHFYEPDPNEVPEQDEKTMKKGDRNGAENETGTRR